MLAGVRKVTDMSERVKLNYLLDFWPAPGRITGAELLGFTARRICRFRKSPDRMAITRQGVSDAVNKARRQLDDYEQKVFRAGGAVSGADERKPAAEPEALNAIVGCGGEHSRDRDRQTGAG